MRQVAPLRSSLEDTPRAAHRLGQQQALRDVLRAGLFAVDVLARAGGEASGRGVPVRPGGDQHRVDVVAGQQLAHVAVGLAVLIAVLLVDDFLTRRRAARPSTSQMATNCTSGSGRKQPRSYVPRLPIPIPPITMRSLGATVPSRPNAAAGMT